MMRTIDEYIARRNELQLRCEDMPISEARKQEFFNNDLGTANRHIARVLEGTIPFVPSVEGEIFRCLQSAEIKLQACPTGGSQ